MGTLKDALMTAALMFFSLAFVILLAVAVAKLLTVVVPLVM